MAHDKYGKTNVAGSIDRDSTVYGFCNENGRADAVEEVYRLKAFEN
jgi:hypothetical protein